MADVDSLGDGAPIYHHDEVHRWINPQWIVADEKVASGRRLSSAAYRTPSSGPCSGFIARECSFAIVVADRATDTVGAIVVRDITDNLHSVVRDVIDGEHPSHVHLVPPQGLSRSALKKLWDGMALRTQCVHGSQRWDLSPSAAADS